MSMRIPRKLKKKIPSGPYCYKVVGDGYYVCPLYSSRKGVDKEFPDEYVGWCNLITHEIDDQCKSCGVKKSY